MAKLGIVTTPPIGTPLPDGGGNINSNFNELYTLLGDGNELYPGIVTSITAGNNISISTSYGNVSISVTTTAFTETLDTVTTRGNVTPNDIRVGVVTAVSFIRNGGTANQFLKADGSIDENTYLTSSSPISLDLDEVTSNGNVTANNISVGSLLALGNVAAGASILAVNAAIASSFRRIGGSSTEFLKGDGSVDINDYATIDYVDNSVGGGYWVIDPIGISTNSNVGIGTSAGNETLIVNGDARIVGVLTVGSASITIDGDNETISVGSGVSITGDGIFVGSGITISSTTNQIFIRGEEVIDRWKIGAVGISTINQVGIGTTAKAEYILDVLGESRFIGSVTATAFVGDGSGLTNVSSANTDGLASIEYVDNKVGLATAGISTEGLASIVYVDNKVGLATAGISTEGLASIIYVDNKVGLSTVGLASTDYVGLSTEGLITNIIGGTDIQVIQSSGIATVSFDGDIKANVVIGDSAPTNPSIGDLWWDSTRLVGFIYYTDPNNNSQWVQFNTTGGGSSGASITYVDNKVGLSTVGLASIAYVDQEIANAGFAQTAGLASIEYVDNKVGLSTVGLASTDYVGLATAGISTEGLASIVYVDQQIASIDTEIISEWILGANGINDYTFTGPGFAVTANDPPLYLVRGQKYKFTNNMDAHPFRIQSTQGISGTPYNDGITNNGVSNGTLEWDVQFDSPGILYYQCTSHSDMNGTIYIVGENEVNPSYTNVNIDGLLSLGLGRIQSNADANLRFGNLPVGAGVRNIAIGDQVLTSLSSGNRNICIGELSYYNTTNGQYNVGLGYRAGQRITNGSFNVIIGGYDGQTDLDIRTSSNNIVISDGEGNIRQYINPNGNVGFGTTLVSEALTVAGVVSATSFYGQLNAAQLTGSLPAIDGSALTGVTATGSGIEVRDEGIVVGTAATIDFGTNIDVSFAAGVATVSSPLVGYATEGYVDNSIVGFITSGALDGYATESYVSTASVAYASVAGISSSVSETIDINTSGIITASQFSGSGSGLTNLPSGQLDGALPAIDGSLLLNLPAQPGNGIVVEDDGVNIGSARTVDFGTGLDVVLSAGIATITTLGGSLKSRTVVSGVTSSLADNAIGNVNISGFKAYNLMKVGLSTAGWLRLYTDSTSRANDASRSIGIDPTPGSGVIAEVVTTGISTTQMITPFVPGGNMDEPPTNTIYASVKNLTGQTATISINLTLLQLEE